MRFYTAVFLGTLASTTAFSVDQGHSNESIDEHSKKLTSCENLKSLYSNVLEKNGEDPLAPAGYYSRETNDPNSCSRDETLTDLSEVEKIHDFDLVSSAMTSNDGKHVLELSTRGEYKLRNLMTGEVTELNFNGMAPTGHVPNSVGTHSVI